MKTRRWSRERFEAEKEAFIQARARGDYIRDCALKDAEAEVERLRAEMRQLQDHIRGESRKRIEQQRRAESAEADAKRLRAEVQRLQEKVLRVVRGEFGQICSYCGWESKKGGAEWEDLQQHIKECPAHPLRAAEADAERLRARVSELELDTATVREERTLELRLAHAREAEARRDVERLKGRLSTVQSMIWQDGLVSREAVSDVIDAALRGEPSAEAQGREPQFGPQGVSRDDLVDDKERNWLFGPPAAEEGKP